MVRSLPRYSIPAWSELQQQGCEKNNAFVETNHHECMQNATCMTMAASGVNAPFVAHSAAFHPRRTDRPTDVRPFDRETESARAAATVPASEPASQAGLLLSSPLPSPPFSPFLSVLPRVARRLKTLFCPHSKLDRRRRLHITYSYSIWTTKSSQQQKRASEPRTDCFRQRQTHPRADRHIT